MIFLFRTFEYIPSANSNATAVPLADPSAARSYVTPIPRQQGHSQMRIGVTACDAFGGCAARVLANELIDLQSPASGWPAGAASAIRLVHEASQLAQRGDVSGSITLLAAVCNELNDTSLADAMIREVDPTEWLHTELLDAGVRQTATELTLPGPSKQRFMPPPPPSPPPPPTAPRLLHHHHHLHLQNHQLCLRRRRRPLCFRCRHLDRPNTPNRPPIHRHHQHPRYLLRLQEIHPDFRHHLSPVAVWMRQICHRQYW